MKILKIASYFFIIFILSYEVHAACDDAPANEVDWKNWTEY